MGTHLERPNTVSYKSMKYQLLNNPISRILQVLKGLHECVMCLYILDMFSFTNAQERRPMIQSHLPPKQGHRVTPPLRWCLFSGGCSSPHDPTQTCLPTGTTA